jgi:putative transposase
LERHGRPEIFNTDQGSQFTSWAWTQRLSTPVSASRWTGGGRFLNNIFIERLWRSLKYECVYLHAFCGGRDARGGIGKWIDFYNQPPPARRTWWRDPSQCISRSTAGFRLGLTPGPPTGSLGGVTTLWKTDRQA